MNTETLTPGPELDALVTKAARTSFDVKKMQAAIDRLPNEGGCVAFDPKPYSTDIAATKELMDRFTMWTVLRHGPDSKPIYRVSITTGDGVTSTTEAGTFEHAFSLAALKVAS